jgi:hypothetical protein
MAPNLTYPTCALYQYRLVIQVGWDGDGRGKGDVALEFMISFSQAKPAMVRKVNG